MDNAQNVNNWITFARNLNGLVKLFSFGSLHKYKTTYAHMRVEFRVKSGHFVARKDFGYTCRDRYEIV
jgi:hypothetical protein